MCFLLQCIGGVGSYVPSACMSSKQCNPVASAVADNAELKD